jgi:hypothetical protein
LSGAKIMVQEANSRDQYLPEQTQKVLQAFEQLGVDEKLALLYYVYEKMGDSITPAAPEATDPELAPRLLGEFFEMSDQQQLAVMREVAACQDTELSRAYGALKDNNQLMVWYAWARAMGDTVVDMPQDYNAAQPIKDVLGHLEELDFQEQISMLREVASGMGYSDVQPIPSQAETGKTPSL